MSDRTKIQKEALDIALKHQRCGLAISMGVGKTLIGLQYINYFQFVYLNKLNILVVAPKLSIFESWKNDAEKFNINIENVHFTTYLSLNKQPLNYDILILDECHSLLYSHKDYLENYDGRILGLTGTPPKWDNSEKGEMVNKYCPIHYSFVTDEAVEHKILNDYRIIVHSINLDKTKNILIENKGSSWMSSEVEIYDYYSRKVTASSNKDKMFNSIRRMSKMMNFKTKLNYAKTLFESISDKCIVFANTKEQADFLCKDAYHTGNKNSEEILTLFNQGVITKMSAVQKLNEGVNIKNLKSGIILHSYSNERQSTQRIGRLLRLNTDETATIHVLCYSGTIDVVWVKNALENFDQSKIIYI